MFNLDGGPDELILLNAALSQLCGPSATDAERDRVQLVLLELAQEGLTTLDDLIARASDLLETSRGRARRQHP